VPLKVTDRMPGATLSAEVSELFILGALLQDGWRYELQGLIWELGSQQTRRYARGFWLICQRGQQRLE
jgi:hypothetical protein